MIFLTVGTQLPFDRLVKYMDEMANELPLHIFGQIGKSSYKPKNFKWAEDLSPTEYRRQFSSARLVVSHAGIGTILTAQKLQKPIIVLPREAKFKEHRNDHQIATCRQLLQKRGVLVARELPELKELLINNSLEQATECDDVAVRKEFVDGLRVEIGKLLGQR